MWNWTLAESWAMCDAIASHLPMPVAMGVLLQSLLGIATGKRTDGGKGGRDASGAVGADEAARDEQLLRRFSA